MTQDRFEDFVRQAAREYHRPPETPRDEMWARIAAARRERRTGPVGQWGRLRHWATWGLAAAAVLAVGIAIGRYTTALAPGSSPVAEGGPSEESQEGLATPYAVAALQHLRQVETFLTVFRTEASERPVESAPASARALLVSTRLLMDSPAARDQRVAALLKDIELVLAQIAQFTAAAGSGELDLIQQGMERRGLLLKLRAAVPEGLSVATAQGVL